MTRIVRRPIEVERWYQDLPYQFWDHGTLHQVVDWLDDWSEMGNWWDGEGERQMIRVWTKDGQIFDLEASDGKWWLYKVWD
ncbi:MAG: hypothetical protein K6T63_02755 [Alicyclobacillus herbarius]|uniref:hypothetical protein n=1 Tax=Alicyclobacillus herbarius TaxID=122960 RepID=UPI000412D197|nr:hypothetical protein [Alicyclobacillus herbarius]MCL6631528.1 hypothetical protein [Alicyclobacillus herbarius]